jgi:hypothetical protein
VDHFRQSYDGKSLEKEQACVKRYAWTTMSVGSAYWNSNSYCGLDKYASSNFYVKVHPKKNHNQKNLDGKLQKI